MRSEIHSFTIALYEYICIAHAFIIETYSLSLEMI